MKSRHEKIRDLAKEGFIPAEICKVVGCSRPLVYKVLNAHGIAIPRNPKLPNPLTPRQKTKMVELHNKELSIREIQSVTGASYYQVRRQIRRIKQWQSLGNQQ